MEISFFSSHSYDEKFFNEANKKYSYKIHYYKTELNIDTVALAQKAAAVCVFVDDDLSSEVIQALGSMGCKLIALRCAGFNNVDLKAAQTEGLKVVHVPAYSPHSVAQHTAALILALNRKIYKAYNRVRDGNFALKGLLGFDLQLKTVGIIGTGKIGFEVAKIMLGFGCKVIAYDKFTNEHLESLGVKYLSRDEVLRESDILTLHCPLTPESKHLISYDSLETLKDGVMLINTSRGGLVNTQAVVEGLKSGKIGHLGLDVYEQETALFFHDRSSEVITDDTFQRLLTFPNVLITGHQAFFTEEALTCIAETTLSNIAAIISGEGQVYEIKP
jgi:D-lactate dehydrogenase